LERALFAGVEAKQLAGSGEWVVSSASRPGVAYRTDGVSCDCEAALLGGDPVCLHRAAYWYAVGVLDLDPEPEPPAPASGVTCWACAGLASVAGRACAVCAGSGSAPLVAQAAALLAAADPGACDDCGELLGDCGKTNDAGQMVCAGCGEAPREAREAAISPPHPAQAA
jgi:hypothetical protein